jgi:hypothetical protein
MAGLGPPWELVMGCSSSIERGAATGNKAQPRDKVLGFRAGMSRGAGQMLRSAHAPHSRPDQMASNTPCISS